MTSLAPFTNVRGHDLMEQSPVATHVTYERSFTDYNFVGNNRANMTELGDLRFPQQWGLCCSYSEL
jgi:hypothetical protein